MPIIEHANRPMPDPVDKVSVRSLVTKEDGAESLTVREMVLRPGFEGRLARNTTDVAYMVMEGSVQMVVGDEVQTVRSGYTLLAPPGVPHKLINSTWVAARMLVISPTDELGTDYLE